MKDRLKDKRIVFSLAGLALFIILAAIYDWQRLTDKAYWKTSGLFLLILLLALYRGLRYGLLT